MQILKDFVGSLIVECGYHIFLFERSKFLVSLLFHGYDLPMLVHRYWEPTLDPFNRIGNFYGDLSGIISPDRPDMKSSLRGRSRNQFISVSLRKRITCGRSEFIAPSASPRLKRLKFISACELLQLASVCLFKTLIYLLVRDNDHLDVFLRFYLGIK